MNVAIRNNFRGQDRGLSPQERLEKRRNVKENGCWESGYTVTKKHRYPTFYVAGKYKKVHRVAYELYVGPIPEGIQVLHSCDNPRCHNPEHLFLGTISDNMYDMWGKGRHNNKGEKNGRAKIGPEEVRAIRISNEPHTIMAKRYALTPTTILSIRRRKLWKHID